MFSYSNYQPPSGEFVVKFVHDQPFAMLCTSSEGAPVATHIPIVFPQDADVSGETLVGKRLWGHMGKANPHWQLLAEQPQGLLIFSSSHAYVSPSTYHFATAVPTLDYATVHLTGRITLITDREQNLEVVKRTVTQLEQRRAEQWNPHDSFGVFEKIIDDVVSFYFDVETETSMFKLSQDMPQDVHSRVVEDLEHGDHSHKDVADLMREIGIDEKLTGKG